MHTPLPPPRAGKARDNLYREGLTDQQIRRLAQGARHKGLRDEATYLRLLLQEARDAGETDDILNITLALARVGEADSRIHNRTRDDGDSQLYKLSPASTCSTASAPSSRPAKSRLWRQISRPR